MRKLPALIAFAATGLLLSLAALGLLLFARSREAPAVGPLAAALAELRVLDFELTDDRGEPADESLFEGQVTILSFIFTRCPLACPGMTRAGIEAQERLAGTGVQLVSISVDPGHDTPEVLAAYAEERGIDRSNWRLLTGDEATVRRLAREGLRFLLEVDPGTQLPMPDGSTISNIAHPTKLILVGPDRRVLGLYDPPVPGEIDRLVADARRAAERAGLSG